MFPIPTNFLFILVNFCAIHFSAGGQFRHVLLMQLIGLVTCHLLLLKNKVVENMLM